MDKWLELKAFAAVVEHDGFAAAARAMNMAPSGISRLIANLENRLGVRLLNRTTRRLTLTDAGALYHDSVRELLTGFEAVEADLAGLSLEPKGKLRMSCVVTLAERWIPDILTEFLATYPRVEIELIETDQPVDLIESRVDLALVTGALKDSSHIVRRVSEFQRLVVASPDYLARCGCPADPGELKQHNCLSFFSAPHLQKWEFQNSNGRQRTVTIGGNFAANGAESILRAATAGIGIARLASFMVASEIESGELVEILEDFRSRSTVPLSVVFPAGRNPSPSVQALVEHLVTTLKSRAPWE